MRVREIAGRLGQNRKLFWGGDQAALASAVQNPEVQGSQDAALRTLFLLSPVALPGLPQSQRLSSGQSVLGVSVFVCAHESSLTLLKLRPVQGGGLAHF